MTAVPVEVAVGVLVDDRGRFLMTQRPPGKPMPGYWEFPGGKLEAGEGVRAALVREFREELAIEITEAHPWFIRHHVYPHATVRLHFWRALAWSGSPQALEGQGIRWESIDNLCVEPWLPGALPLKRWLSLPDWYAISCARETGVATFLAALERALVRDRLRLVQLREPGMGEPEFATLFLEVRARCREHGARLLISSRHAPRWWAAADGVHATARDLGLWTERPDVAWCAASCHDRADLGRAAQINADFAVAGPIRSTPGHPAESAIGWQGFSELVATTEVPVFALGGIGASDRGEALLAGAHGIAAIRASWGARKPGATAPQRIRG